MEKCKICGREMEHFPYKDLEGNFYCGDECHTIGFWNACLDGSAIIVNGICYHDGGNGRSENGFKGFGGNVYCIKDLRTGEMWKTDNLWYNGKIPTNMRKDHPDTHEFVKDRPVTDL